jgi:transcription antitermination factor NusG
MIGAIKYVDQARQKVGIILNMFGRETPVEMDFDQVESLQK